MEISEAPAPRFKSLNKHNTHNVHRDEGCYEFNNS